MYQKILVAFDGTVPGKAALHQGAELARVCNAELYVLAIVVTAGGLLLDPAVVSVDLLEVERHVLRDALDDAIRDLHAKGIKAVVSIRDGEPAREIVIYAHEINADLVVAGHSEKGVLARWFEGSVDTELLARMPCSLLIATAGWPLTSQH